MQLFSEKHSRKANKNKFNISSSFIYSTVFHIMIYKYVILAEGPGIASGKKNFEKKNRKKKFGFF